MGFSRVFVLELLGFRLCFQPQANKLNPKPLHPKILLKEPLKEP